MPPPVAPEPNSVPDDTVILEWMKATHNRRFYGGDDIRRAGITLLQTSAPAEYLDLLHEANAYFAQKYLQSHE